MSKKIWVIVVVILLGVVVWYSAFESAAPEGQNATDGQSLSLAVMKVERQEVALQEELPGRTVAYKTSEIRPQVGGIITERLFVEGSEVEEGQQLYQIDPAPYEAAYNSARADLAKAQANVKSVKAKAQRYKKLVKIEAVSKQDYDDIQANLAQAQADIAIAKAAVERAKINLDYTKVYAPIHGRIGKSQVTKGALVTADQAEPLATITQLDPIYVDMPQSSAELMRLRQRLGALNEVPVTLRMEGMQEPYKEKGKLQFHEVTVDRTTDSVQLRALFPNPDLVLLPGLFVRAQLQLENEPALTVPQSATARNPEGQLFVWKLDENQQAQQQVITAERAVKGKWVVASGLQAGDVIITEGLIALRPGVTVSPVFAEAADTSPATAGGEE